MMRTEQRQDVSIEVTFAGLSVSWFKWPISGYQFRNTLLSYPGEDNKMN